MLSPGVNCVNCTLPSTDSDFIVGCSISWSPSGDRLSAAMGSGWLIVWDINTGREVMSVYAHVASVNCVSWSPDGSKACHWQ